MGRCKTDYLCMWKAQSVVVVAWVLDTGGEGGVLELALGVSTTGGFKSGRVTVHARLGRESREDRELRRLLKLRVQSTRVREYEGTKVPAAAMSWIFLVLRGGAVVATGRGTGEPGVQI
jgi:hypothetical protein